MNSYRPALMSTADLEPAVAGEPVAEAAIQTEAREREECMACGHGPERHDRIAQRYCDATVSGALTRRCICPAP